MITFTMSAAVQEMPVWFLRTVVVSEPEHASRDNPYIVFSNSKS